MKDELASALKNAIERGSSLEQAKQSLINAGYNQTEINEAANSFLGATPMINQQPQQMPIQQMPSQSSQKAPVQNMPIAQQQMSQQTMQQFPSQTPQQIPPQTLQQTPVQPSTISVDEKKERSKRNLKIWITLISMFLVLIILIGLGLYYKTNISDLLAKIKI